MKELTPQLHWPDTNNEAKLIAQSVIIFLPYHES